MKHRTARREVAAFMRRLYRQGLTTTSGGNISLRLDENLFAITPARLDKARLKGRQIVLIDREGLSQSPEPSPTSEYRMHLAIYARRPDVRAIAHAHPTLACAFTAAETPISFKLVGELYMMVPRVAHVPYIRTGTEALAERVGEASLEADVIMMANHGITALGASLLEAFDRLELVETAARMTLAARQLDGVHELNDEQLVELDALMNRPVSH